MISSQWEIRQAEGQDLNFIYSTWLQSYRVDSSIGRSVKKSVFFDHYYGVVDLILSKDSVEITIAHDIDDKNVILGYLVAEPEVIHYIFIKESFRKFGIARSLFERTFGKNISASAALPEVTLTHCTQTAKPILMKHPELLYNPFLLFERLTSQKSE